jgi:hypothetical protein
LPASVNRFASIATASAGFGIGLAVLVDGYHRCHLERRGVSVALFFGLRDLVSVNGFHARRLFDLEGHFPWNLLVIVVHAGGPFNRRLQRLLWLCRIDVRHRGKMGSRWWCYLGRRFRDGCGFAASY